MTSNTDSLTFFNEFYLVIIFVMIAIVSFTASILFWILYYRAKKSENKNGS